MNSRSHSLAANPAAPALAGCPDPDASVPLLIGQVYESAPASLRAKIVSHLLQPLGLLSLVALANGVFATIRFRAGLAQGSVALDDVVDVQASDVIALADWVQQVSVEVVDGLAQLIGTSALVSGSAAAALLTSLLLQRIKQRRALGPTPSDD